MAKNDTLYTSFPCCYINPLTVVIYLNYLKLRILFETLCHFLLFCINNS